MMIHNMKCHVQFKLMPGGQLFSALDGTLRSGTSLLSHFSRGQKGSSRPANPNSRFTPVKHSTPPSRVSTLTQTPIPSNDPATSEFHAADGSEQSTTSIDNSRLPARKCKGTQTCTNPTDILTTRKSDSHLGPNKLFDDAGTESDSEDGLKKWFEDGGLENSNNDDPELAKLIQIANNISPSDTLPDLEKSIDVLEKYLESRAQKKVEEDQARNKEVERAEKLSQEREEALHPVAEKLKRASKIITSSMKKAFSLVLSVLKGGLKVLETLSFMAAELTFQTHYEVALKAILFLVTAYDSAVELTREIKTVFDKLGGYVAEIKDLNKYIKSVPMSKATSRLFVSIVEFIVSAGTYLTWHPCVIGKMVTYAGGRNERFQNDLKAITAAYEEVKRVLQIANVMIDLQILKNTGKLREDTALIIEQLRSLNSSVPPEMSTQLREVHNQTTFHAELHVQTLRAGLFRTIYEPSEERVFNNKERIFLSPRDRWPRQFRPPRRSDDSQSTAKLIKTYPSSCPLIWIAGHVSRRNVSWVSSLSVDLIQYFCEFSNFDVAYIFCKHSGSRYTPTLLIKGLVAQLMDIHPTIVTKNLRQLSLNRFHKIGQAIPEEGSAELVWELLMDVLRLLEEASELRDRVVLLLIDRLYLCISETGFTVLQGLIPRLQNLSHERARVQVIITTARLSAHTVPTLRKGPEWLQAYGKETHG
ncbi:hypothetical protein LA080_009425 [Diaporthe eres]|nr:hypothetical protein LA080_009425 [Diaporthe eres]